MTTFNPWRLAAIAALSLSTLVAASCGSTSTSTSTGASTDSAAAESEVSESESPDGEMDDSEMSDMSDMADEEHGASHEHGDEMLEVDAASAPSVAIEVIADPKSGHNVKVTTANFTVAPENASTEHVEGEGHMHLIIDGEKQLRFYNDWIHVDGLDEGEHTIEVELNANTHAAYAVEGERVAASQVITVEEPGEHGHGEQGQVQLDAERGVLGVSFLDDPKGGWNFQVDTAAGFTFAPENASTEHVDGEGHLHWYIDGVRQGRLYGPWFYVADQGEGEHTITVGMSTNDHRDYAVGDMVAELDTLVGVANEGSTESDADDEVSADTLMVMVDYADGNVALDANGSSSDRVDAPLGSTVRLMITTDVAEHVHVHGYDLFVDLVPGDTAILEFVAEIPGLVEVELEDSGTFLFELSTK